MEKQKRELLEQADWKDIIPRLLMHAINKLRQKYFLYNSPLAGFDIKDIAQEQVMEAIGKLWSEKVNWKYEEKDNLLYFLQNTINSQISHLFDNMEYLTTERFPITHEDADSKPLEVEELLKRANPVETHAESMNPSLPPDPLSELIDREEEEAAMATILGQIKGDGELEDVVLCIMNDICKPKEIAKELSLKVGEINNRQKRLRRVYKNLLEQVRKEKRS